MPLLNPRSWLLSSRGDQFERISANLVLTWHFYHKDPISIFCQLTIVQSHQREWTGECVTGKSNQVEAALCKVHLFQAVFVTSVGIGIVGISQITHSFLATSFSLSFFLQLHRRDDFVCIHLYVPYLQWQYSQKIKLKSSGTIQDGKPWSWSISPVKYTKTKTWVK